MASNQNDIKYFSSSDVIKWNGNNSALKSSSKEMIQFSWKFIESWKVQIIIECHRVVGVWLICIDFFIKTCKVIEREKRCAKLRKNAFHSDKASYFSHNYMLYDKLVNATFQLALFRSDNEWELIQMHQKHEIFCFLVDFFHILF